MGDQFIQQKHQWLFRFFDTDNNGVLERKDFEARAGRACEAVNTFFSQHQNDQNFQQHLPQVQKAQYQAYNMLFDTLNSQITNNAQRVSTQDWQRFGQMVQGEVQRTGQMPSWFNDLLVYYFRNVLDFNNNGAIDFYEMTFMGDAPIEITWYCFDKLTDSNQKKLDLNMFLEMTKQYMTSPDPNCKSRYMFGFIQE